MKKTFRDAFVDYDGTILELGNSRFSRRFDLSLSSVRTVALVDACGMEFGGENPDFSDFSFYGDRCIYRELRYRLIAVSANIVGKPLFDAPHLKVTISIAEDGQQLRFRRDFFIYPELPALAMRNRINSPVYPLALWNHRRGIRDNFQKNARPGLVFEGCVDSLAPAGGFFPDRVVEYRGRTDYNDDQVIERAAAGKYWNGNLLFWRNSHGDGFFYLQEAPPSEERRDVEDYDFRFDGVRFFSCGWGVVPGELAPEREYASPRHVLFLHHRDEDAIALLREYLRRRFPQKMEQYGITVNPWGSGNFYQRNTPDFLLAEISAAAECGAQVYQIDDSWQEGGVLGHLTGRNQHIDPTEFWQVSEKLWGGNLSVPAALAQEKHLELSLWVAPGGNVAYRDWRLFIRLFHSFSRRYGIHIFKIDAVNLFSYEAERNLELMLRVARRRSGGKNIFHFDLTGWGQRQGYFRFLEYGIIFLENRYVNESNGIGYHPERTWRNVWRLAEYNRLQNIQIEVPNMDEVNDEFYCSKNERNPKSYPWEYWLAIALFANVLLWFAPSLLPCAKRCRAAAIMNWRKQKAVDLFSGEIYRFGTEPNGSTLAGLYCVPHDCCRTQPLLIAFRERNGPESTVVALPRLAGSWHWTLELGEGSMTSADNGHTFLAIPSCPGFAVFSAL